MVTSFSQYGIIWYTLQKLNEDFMFLFSDLSFWHYCHLETKYWISTVMSKWGGGGGKGSKTCHF